MEKGKDIAVEVIIEGKVEQVFDLITQVRFWPQWHVLTRAVTGVTERPFLPGDNFTEFIRTPKGTAEVPWTVVKYERFKKVSIQTALNGSIITYTFEQKPEGTLFKRTLAKGESTGGSTESSEGPTSNTEQQSVANLKALVERIIKNETKGPVYP